MMDDRSVVARWVSTRFAINTEEPDHDGAISVIHPRTFG